MGKSVEDHAKALETTASGKAAALEAVRLAHEAHEDNRAAVGEDISRLRGLLKGDGRK